MSGRTNQELVKVGPIPLAEQVDDWKLNRLADLAEELQ
jgi:hypothetical protein